MYKFYSIRFGALFIYLFTACATSPLGRSQLTLMEDRDMNRMGVQVFENHKKNTRISNDPAPNRYVQCVSMNLTRHVKGEWEVILFEEKSPNAFALPGGKIGIHTGLLQVARNQHQLATVIGHEIAHVMARHGNERVSQKYTTQAVLAIAQVLTGAATGNSQNLMGLLGLGAQYGILMPFGRSQESEADLVGLDLMAKAGFDPRESIKLWQNMATAGGSSTAEFLSTHPSHGTRIKDLNERMPRAMEIRQRARNRGNKPQCRQTA